MHIQRVTKTKLVLKYEELVKHFLQSALEYRLTPMRDVTNFLLNDVSKGLLMEALSAEQINSLLKILNLSKVVLLPVLGEWPL